jgi:4-hydroxybenzoate polyprenyltransferase
LSLITSFILVCVSHHSTPLLHFHSLHHPNGLVSAIYSIFSGRLSQSYQSTSHSPFYTCLTVYSGASSSVAPCGFDNSRDRRVDPQVPVPSTLSRRSSLFIDRCLPTSKSHRTSNSPTRRSGVPSTRLLFSLRGLLLHEPYAHHVPHLPSLEIVLQITI